MRIPPPLLPFGLPGKRPSFLGGLLFLRFFEEGV